MKGWLPSALILRIAQRRGGSWLWLLRMQQLLLHACPWVAVLLGTARTGPLGWWAVTVIAECATEMCAATCVLRCGFFPLGRFYC